jgi:biotin carboxyl carrier protein
VTGDERCCKARYRDTSVAAARLDGYHRSHAMPTDAPSSQSHPPRQIYNQEAIEHYASYGQARGAPLRLSSVWTGEAYWLLLGVVIAGLLYMLLGRLNEYAAGPAIVRVEDRSPITVTIPGVVSSIHVRPGQRVEAQDLLVSMYAGEEAADFDRLSRLYETQLAKTLFDAADRVASQELNTISSQRALAKARLEQRFIRAPTAGIVSDVRIRVGQHSEPGDILLAINDGKARWSLVAVLPGQYRPVLHSGTAMRLEMNGYRYAYSELEIDSVGAEVVGPHEVRRFLGQEIADTIQIEGPVVFVHAYLPSNTFSVGSRTYQYYEGLQGTAEARVNTSSILLALFPGIRTLIRGKE